MGGEARSRRTSIAAQSVPRDDASRPPAEDAETANANANAVSGSDESGDLGGGDFGGATRGDSQRGVVRLTPSQLTAELLDDSESSESVASSSKSSSDSNSANARGKVFSFASNAADATDGRLARESFEHGPYREFTLEEFDAEIVMERALGEGASGTVYRAAWLHPSVEVAVKMLHGGGAGLSAEQTRAFRREVAILRDIKHPRVVGLFGACFAPPRMALVMEFVRGGSLHEILHGGGGGGGGDRDDGPRSVRHLAQLRVCEDVASAMEYLHGRSPKIVHRDLKPQNVLVDDGGRAHLADFGIARAVRGAFLETSAHAVGTLNYMAPECFGDGAEVDEKCDVYSFALIAHEMCTGEIPWRDARPMQIAMRVAVERARPIVPEECPPTHAALIAACWAHEPSARPSFEHVRRVVREARVAREKEEAREEEEAREGGRAAGSSARERRPTPSTSLQPSASRGASLDDASSAPTPGDAFVVELANALYDVARDAAMVSVAAGSRSSPRAAQPRRSAGAAALNVTHDLELSSSEEQSTSDETSPAMVRANAAVRTDDARDAR